MQYPLHGITDTLVGYEQDAPQLVSEPFRMTERPAYMDGIETEQRPDLPGYNSGIVGTLLLVVVIVALSVIRSQNFLKTFVRDLIMLRRRRTNVFDEHTENRKLITLAFILLACMCEGILLFVAADLPQSGEHKHFIQFGLCSAAAVAFYMFQLAAYSTVATVFGGHFERVQWLRGFNASQALLGLALFVPAFMALYDPVLTYPILITAIILYILARILFIRKGLKIFYTKPFSLIYFILYLCTLEIVPLVFLYRTSVSLGFLNL